MKYKSQKINNKLEEILATLKRDEELFFMPNYGGIKRNKWTKEYKKSIYVKKYNVLIFRNCSTLFIIN